MSLLFAMPDGPAPLSEVNAVLAERHYLGPVGRGCGWRDRFGVLVVASPTARHVPGSWLELTRWCLYGERNGGSRQWASVRRWLLSAFPEATTVLSYSDPEQGHTGSLYRACGWWWAPTWHRIVTPPTGNGTWNGRRRQAAKDRWIFALRPDATRAEVLRLEPTYTRRFPATEYREPGGADFGTWRALAEGGA